MDIREFLPEITNEEVALLQTLSCYEWLLSKRLHNGRRFGGKEISEEDLLQGFPKEKLKEAKRALKSLEKKRIIVKKPKPSITIYQTPPEFFTNPFVVFFIEKITENEMLRQSLVDKTIKFTKVSETLMRIVSETFSSKSNIIERRITASKKTAFDGDNGLVVFLKIRCPNDGHFEINFDLTDPSDISKLIFESNCTCGSLHMCNAYGRVFGKK